MFVRTQLQSDVNLRSLLYETSRDCLLTEIELAHYGHVLGLTLEILGTQWRRPKMSSDDFKLFLYCLCVWTLEHFYAGANPKHTMVKVYLQ